MASPASHQLPEIAAFGECMLEVTGRFGAGARLGFGGDTLNTSIYLARLGVRVGYVTAIGVDPLSDDLLQAWHDEGLDDRWVLRSPTRLPGIYAIRNDDQGERQFFYWRTTSAARDFFSLPRSENVIDQLESIPHLYLSGITLSIFDTSRHTRIVHLASRIRARGGGVFFDPNYRPQGWSAPESARAAMEALGPHISLVLPTYEDECALWGDADPCRTIERWRGWGVPEIVVKSGPDGAIVHSGSVTTDVPVPDRIMPVDSTGAGDSFNAGYIAARLKGLPPVRAAQAGHALAAEVICHPGAIIPRHVLPHLPGIMSI